MFDTRNAVRHQVEQIIIAPVPAAENDDYEDFQNNPLYYPYNKRNKT